MSLSGNLGFVPLDEVLRLLKRSEQDGCVDVRGTGLHGRVFIGGSGIDIATTYSDEDLHRHLTNSGFADEKLLNRITSGETTLAAAADSSHGIVELIREMSVESLYQMSVNGDEFYVHEGATTPYASPKSFDLESLLKEAEERSREWKQVTEVISDLNRPVDFRRDLGEREEVKVEVDDWMVLSEIGTGSSVTEIAESLGTTEFWTARVTARLVKNDLVSLSDINAGPEVNESDPTDVFVASEDTDGLAADDADHDELPAEVEVDPHQSWWNEAVDSDESGSGDEPVDTEDPASEIVDEPLAGQGDTGESDDEASVEEDTETFLEKVFSELEAPEQEPDEGHGLLRRRRMGTLRDFSSDS